GNVMGSRGSVLPFFRRLIEEGKTTLPITDVAMTRFVITLDQGVAFVLMALRDMYGGELFVPKLPSIRMVDLVSALHPDVTHEIVGMRPGEKLHEVMIPLEESRHCVDVGDHYIVQPAFHWWNVAEFMAKIATAAKPIDGQFEYSSGTNEQWLSGSALKAFVETC
ncbi:MAG: polysaccharide biosynthesis protein, partial [Alphaproteobacteria bacterium]